MRVRQWAVVGAAMAAVWAGGAGIAQAGEDSAQGPNCTDLVGIESADVEGTLPDDCGLPFEPGDGCGVLLLSSADTVESTDPCSVEVDVVVDGDCESPETFTFYVYATGLASNEDYVFGIGTDEFTGPNGEPFEFEFPFTTDTNGVFDNDPAGDGSGGFKATEGAAQAPAGGFTLDYGVVTDDEAWQPVYLDSTKVEPCKETPSETPQPAAPTTPDTTPVVPIAAPVVVQPVAAHPAVLANTGTPVTTAALLGGGLLVAGAGAVVAGRRRAS